MIQPLLINKATVEKYLQVAIGYDTNDFNRFIREAQEFDLKPLLCDEFYFDMLKKKADLPYTEIIAGQEYTIGGKIYYHEGLEAVLSYFTYARFVLKSGAVSTSHGVVTKKTPNSEPISHSEKKDIYYSCRQDANKLFADVAKYMDRKEINYKDCLDCDDTTDGDIITRAPQW
jgi:hypothetical protein